MEPLAVYPSTGRLLALLENIRLRRKGLKARNTLAYYRTVLGLTHNIKLDWRGLAGTNTVAYLVQS